MTQQTVPVTTLWAGRGAGQYRLDLDARPGLPYESERISSWIHISPKDSLPHLNQRARPWTGHPLIDYCYLSKFHRQYFIQSWTSAPASSPPLSSPIWILRHRHSLSEGRGRKNEGAWYDLLDFGPVGKVTGRFTESQRPSVWLSWHSSRSGRNIKPRVPP